MSRLFVQLNKGCGKDVGFHQSDSGELNNIPQGVKTKLIASSMIVRWAFRRAANPLGQDNAAQVHQ